MALRSNTILHSILIATAVVFFWRGSWGLMDLYLVPENQITSMVLSVVIGLIILIVTQSVHKELV